MKIAGIVAVSIAALATNTYATLLPLSTATIRPFISGQGDSSRVGTALPYSTGFESAEGYTNNAQLATQGASRWTGDGQDTTGWTITNAATNGGPSSGTQWVLTANTGTTNKWNWTYVNPVVSDFSVNPVIRGSADVKIIAPASGNSNRSTSAGLQMYDSNVTVICQIDLMRDTQNLYGLGANRMIFELIGGDGVSGWAYDAGPSALATWVNLRMDVNFQTNTCTGYVANTALPDTVPTGGQTDYHDFDMFGAKGSTTSGGTTDRSGFDNYSVLQTTPEPATVSLIAFGVFGLLRRRR